MARIPESEAKEWRGRLTPADLLDLCGSFDKMLRVTLHDDYSPRMDATYRTCRKVFVESLRLQPFLRRLAKQFDDRLPPSLAIFATGDSVSRTMWDHHDYGGRAILIRLQGDLLTAQEAAGCPPKWGPEPKALPEPAQVADTPSAPVSVPNRSQRRTAQKRARAIGLRGQGIEIKNIARELGCTERTVYAYLSDGNDSATT